MNILINTTNQVTSSENFNEQIRQTITDSMGSHGAHITRIEVHLSDENGGKFGIDDKRCLIEARMEHMKPVAVSHNAANFLLAVQGATERLHRSLEHIIGRRESQRDHKNLNERIVSADVETEGFTD
jgi:ribosome-associated translation inhibitor RaiA